MSMPSRWLRVAGLALATAAPALIASSAHAGPERHCDCRDNDGDGAIDERVDCEYPLAIEATADDELDLAIDGQPLGGNAQWQQTHVVNTAVSAGVHLLSVVARDRFGVAQGFLAEVSSPFLGTRRTGAGFWSLQSSLPADPNWRVNGNGLFTPDSGHLCANSAVWGGQPASLAAADWVWAGGCDPDFDPTENYGIAKLQICGEASVCCALDDGTTVTVTAHECDKRGGQQTWADLCEEICCQLEDGTVVTTTAGTCEAKGGQPAPPELCLPEDCNCEDDDGDGLVDEGVDCEYEGRITITADDSYDLWLDGNYQGGNGTWSQASTYPFAVGPGFHAFAVEAQDTQWSWQGLIARVFPPFAASYDTGIGRWQLSSTIPAGTAWRTTGAGLNMSDANAHCGNQGAWGGQPGALAGATWVWDGGCSPRRNPRQNAAYTEFEACVEAWVCCLLEDGTLAQTNAIECEFNGQIVSWDECREVRDPSVESVEREAAFSGRR